MESTESKTCLESKVSKEHEDNYARQMAQHVGEETKSELSESSLYPAERIKDYFVESPPPVQPKLTTEANNSLANTRDVTSKQEDITLQSDKTGKQKGNRERQITQDLGEDTKSELTDNIEECSPSPTDCLLESPPPLPPRRATEVNNSLTMPVSKQDMMILQRNDPGKYTKSEVSDNIDDCSRSSTVHITTGLVESRPPLTSEAVIEQKDNNDRQMSLHVREDTKSELPDNIEECSPSPAELITDCVVESPPRVPPKHSIEINNSLTPPVYVYEQDHMTSMQTNNTGEQKDNYDWQMPQEVGKETESQLSDNIEECSSSPAELTTNCVVESPPPVPPRHSIKMNNSLIIPVNEQIHTTIMQTNNIGEKKDNNDRQMTEDLGEETKSELPDHIEECSPSPAERIIDCVVESQPPVPPRLITDCVVESPPPAPPRYSIEMNNSPVYEQDHTTIMKTNNTGEQKDNNDRQIAKHVGQDTKSELSDNIEECSPSPAEQITDYMMESPPPVPPRHSIEIKHSLATTIRKQDLMTALQTNKTGEQNDNHDRPVAQHVGEDTKSELSDNMEECCLSPTHCLEDSPPPGSPKPATEVKDALITPLSKQDDFTILQTDNEGKQSDSAQLLSSTTPWSMMKRKVECGIYWNKMGTPVFEAIYNRSAKQTDELHVEKGDIFEILDHSNEYRWKVLNHNGKTGYVPASFLKKHEFRPIYANITTGDREEQINLRTLKRLISDAGAYFSKQLLLQEVLKRFSTLNEFVANEDKNPAFRISVLSYLRILFPLDNTPTDLDKWEQDLVKTVLFQCCNLDATARDITDQLSSASYFYIGHFPKVALDHDEFQTSWTYIYQLLVTASNLLTDSKCKTMLIDKMKIIEQTRIDEIEQQSRFETVNENIIYFPRIQLGHGASSIVFEGRFGIPNRFPIAVKCITCSSDEHILREIQTLEEMESSRHPNVIGYYGFDTKLKKVYIALELCDGTLEKYVRNEQWRSTFRPVNVNKCLANGLYFLHSKNIVHRDLKPSNIFIVLENEFTVKKVVLGDFGSAKVTPGTLSSLTGNRGTPGYIAPETWKAIISSKGDQPIQNHLSKRSDIFSLGLLFFFTVTFGLHPFGDSENGIQCQLNIGQGQLPELDELHLQHCSLRHLLNNLLTDKPEDRQNAQYVCSHPAMWTYGEILEYFSNISDIFEDKLIKNDKAKKTFLEDPNIIPGCDWMTQLSNVGKNQLHKYFKKYRLANKPRPFYGGKEGSVRHLLRAIRNTNHHYEAYPLGAQLELGEYPRGHVETWLAVCPELLMHVYNKLGLVNKH